MPITYFIMRVTVPDVSAAFDKWYAEEHLPDAAKSFGAQVLERERSRGAHRVVSLR